MSNERFAESVVHRKAERFGAALIRHELRAHALDPQLIDQQFHTLRDTEAERAKALWERRFGVAPDSPQARVRQLRFLISRGFSAAIAHRIVGGDD